jgi:autotransporter-associated beta strand protein
MKRVAVLSCALLLFLAVWLTKSNTEKTASIHLPNQLEHPKQAHSHGSGSASAAAPQAREMNPAVNPYAHALREAGQPSQPWTADFIGNLTNTTSGAPIEFQLPNQQPAKGTIQITQHRDGKVSYISGELAEPEPGKFFFLTPPAGSKAGLLAGVVEFPGSKRAFRVEPTGPNGSPEMWQRRMEEVLCMTMPLAEQSEQADGETANMPPLRPDLVPDYVPGYNSNIVSLQSYPGSDAVLLLDFFGGYTASWGGVSYPKPNVSNAQIKDVWKRVAEDYMPFNINVTTDIEVYRNAPARSRQICVFTPTTAAMPSGAAGVAYIGSWDWGSDTVCWSIYTSGKSAGEVGSHEAGHTLNLGHQGTSTAGYYGGHGSGATGWGPIMGAGYYQNVITWARGEYQDANNQQEELDVIVTQNTGVAYRTDDTGSTLDGARYLELFSNYSATGEGVIETTEDTDSFQFTTTGGTVSLTAKPVGDWANLAISATLVNQANTVIASNNPQTSLSATISTYVPAGTYTFNVTGAGRNNPLTDGFTSYGSLGYYSISGSVAQGRLPDRFTVAEHVPAGTVVGTVLPRTGAGNYSYTIVGGNTGNTFGIDAAGLLTVADNEWLDYRRLATNTMFTVQFELFVDIVNLDDNSKTELNRRVVVAVTDVNDAPVVTPLQITMLQGTRTETTIGKVEVEDPDAYQALSFSIISGNTGNAFAINSSGYIRVIGTVEPSEIPLQIAVRDSHASNPLTSTGLVNITVITNLTPFRPGSIGYAAYDGVGSGTTVGIMTSNSRWPRDPSLEIQLTSFDAPKNRKDNYGSTIRGYLVPPVSGSYRFWIASDDSSDLFFSTTTNSGTLARIAYLSGAASYKQWNKAASQRSAPINLVAGQGYYIEARQKEGGGDDHVEVAWSGPATGGQTNIIPGLYLAPFPMNYMPHASGFTTTLRRDAFTGYKLGRVEVTDVNAEDTHTFAMTGGNTAFFRVDTNSGDVFVANEAMLRSLSATRLTLQVTAYDSGTPRFSSNATVTVTIAASNYVNSVVRREIFYTGSGNAVTDFINHPTYPAQPSEFQTLSGLVSAENTGDNYGSRIRALLIPPTTGEYRLFVASDDASELWLSSDDAPENLARIAYLTGHTTPSNWTANATQTSPPVWLTAGRRYYLQVLHKEGGGDDHVQVGWRIPGSSTTNTVPASALAAVDLNYAPVLTNQTFSVLRDAPPGTLIGTVSGQTGPMETLTYKLLSSDWTNVFELDPATGNLLLRSNVFLEQTQLFSAPLKVAVQDSGYDGLYPLGQAIGTVTVNIIDSSATAYWAGSGTGNTWSEVSNWLSEQPANGKGLWFNGSSQPTNENNLLDWARFVRLNASSLHVGGNSLAVLNGLTNFGANTWAVDTTIAGNQTWSSSSGPLSIAGGVTNQGATWNLIANSELRLSGGISGTGLIRKTGAARLTIGGTNSFDGELNIASAGSVNALELTGAGPVEMPNVDLALSGRFSLGTLDATIGALNGTGSVFASSGARKLTIGANDHSGSFSGGISNSTGAAGVTLRLIKAGTGRQVLASPSTFSGGLTIRGGQVIASHGNAVGSGIISLGDAGTSTNEVALLLDTAVVVANNITVPASAASEVRLGTLNLVANANSQFSGTLALSRDIILQAGSSDRTTFANRLYGSGDVHIESPYFQGRRVVFDRPSGTANDFVGDLWIENNAVLQLGATTLLGNRTIPNVSTVHFGPGARMRIASTGSIDSETVGGLHSESSGAGVIELLSGSSFSFVLGANNKDANFSGTLSNYTGSLGITKIGTGMQVLANANSHSGNSSVNSGILALAHPQALGATSAGTMVNNGGTLGLSNNVPVASEPLTITGSGYASMGALANLDGINRWDGPLTLSGDCSLGAAAGQLTVAGSLSALSGKLTVNCVTNGAVIVVNAITGSGYLVKNGRGELRLMGANTFAGPLYLTEGQLTLSAGASLMSGLIDLGTDATLDAAPIGGWSVVTGQRLQGSGQVRGATTVLGTLAPGASVGVLRFSDSLELRGTLEMELGRQAGLLTNDMLLCDGPVSLGGRLVISLAREPVQAGDHWKLFSGPVPPSGQFATIDLPALGTGLAWDTTQLATDGILRVNATQPVTPPRVEVSLSGNALSLSWPEGYGTYILESQTNAPGAGIGGQWYPVPDVQGNYFAPAIQRDNGSIFYRLRKGE